METALVLGGGGARGLAHLGVLEALEEHDLMPSFVAGTSMGAIIGGAYALTLDTTTLKQNAEKCLNNEALRKIEKRFGEDRHSTDTDGFRGRLQKIFRDMHRIYLWNKATMDQSLIDSEVISELIHELVNDATFADLQMPFYAVAYDLNSVSDVVLGDGSLTTALRASSAVPGVFEPVRSGEHILVDGCVDQEIPARTARSLGAETMITVDVCADSGADLGNSAAEIMARVNRARVETIRQQELKLADVVIRPEVGNMHWSQFSRAEEAFDLGRKAAHEQLPAIRKALGRKKWPQWLTHPWHKTPPRPKIVTCDKPKT